MSPLRSVLFVPGSRPDRFAKAMAAGADAVVFDLEDSVDAPKKADARRRSPEFLATTSAGSVARFVRVNAPGSAWHDGRSRLAGRRGRHIEAVVLPKVETAADIERCGARCRREAA